MLHTIEESIGIDAVIEKVKATVYSEMELKFPSARIDGYGRVYRNQREEGLVPEFRSGNEYKDVLLNDTKDVIFSFIPSEESTTEDEFVFVNEVKLAFFLNLNKLYGYYVDQRAQAELVSIVRNNARERYIVTGIETGVENVFNGFQIDKILWANIAPWHCFSISMEMFYNLNTCS